MKNSLLIIVLLFVFRVFGQVPDTETFSLQDVVDEILPSSTSAAPTDKYDLQDCVADAIEENYDPTYYTSPADSLLEFRNYGAEPTLTTETFSTTGTHTWTCPAGVTSVTAEVWGAGGGGGGGGSTYQGGGGGGGNSFIAGTSATTPGVDYTYKVGAGGAGSRLDGSSGGQTQWVWNSGININVYGAEGGLDYTNGAYGGNPGNISYTEAALDYMYYGGSGADGEDTFSGGGGGAAGTNGTGYSGNQWIGGAARTENGGKGGDGQSNVSSGGGSGGAPYGAGGGGATGTATGGNGFSGFIRITYYE